MCIFIFNYYNMGLEELYTSNKNDELKMIDYEILGLEKTLKNPKLKITREGPLAYYEVQRWDTTEIIRNKLARNPEFSYLSQDSYKPDRTWRSVKWFNISNSSLRPWMKLMVPLKIENRQIEDNVFLENCKSAINKMKSDQIYWKRITTLVNNIWINNLARVMSAFARVETANWSKWTKIWTWWLYRYESTNTYSISYYHIIPKWWWAQALQNLKMNKWDTCDPVKSWMLFLWFWCEIENDMRKKGLTIEQCLNPSVKWWYSNAAKIYNSWSKSYKNLLRNSY